jgi:adenylate kinase family enzyme
MRLQSVSSPFLCLIPSLSLACFSLRISLLFSFPRNQDNLDGWNGAMSDFAVVEFCLVLDCPEAVMESRLLKRGETSGRIDDNAASIKKRFLTYIDSTKPVIATFEQQGKVRVVSAAAPKEQVWEEVKQIFQAVQW